MVNKLPNENDILTIQKYCNLDEGFEEIAPEFLNAEVNPVLSLHLTQLKFHRGAVEKILNEEWNRLMEDAW